MTTDVYQFDIARTDKASDLHALTADIGGDDTLTSDEKEALLDQIRARFCVMNARALAQQKPRWHL